MERSTLIKNGWIVTNEERLGDIKGGSILIRDGAIVEIGQHVEAPADAEIIDATGMIVIPGLIDSHKHLWQAALRGICGDLTLLGYFHLVRQNFIAAYQPEDVRIGSYASAMEMISSGTTSVLDHAHCIVSPDHADAALEGVRQSGMRGIWAYGFCPVYESAAFTTHEDRINDAYRMRKSFGANDGLLRMGTSMTEQGLLPQELTEMEVGAALDMNVKWTAHTHCGNGKGSQSRGIWKLVRKNMVNELAILSHCNEFGYNEFAMMKDVGAFFASSPDTELYMGLVKPVNFIEALAAEVDISIGTDTVACMSGDMFPLMRLSMVVARQQVNGPASANFDPISHQRVSVRDVFKWATINGAKAMGIDHLVGSLAPGKRADIVLVNGADANLAPVHDPVSSLVLCGQASNVDTVLIDGVVRKRHGKLVGMDMGRMASDLSASHARLMAAVPVPETGGHDLDKEVERWQSRMTEVATA